jgi:hypothetical protein
MVTIKPNRQNHSFYNHENSFLLYIIHQSSLSACYCTLKFLSQARNIHLKAFNDSKQSNRGSEKLGQNTKGKHYLGHSELLEVMFNMACKMGIRSPQTTILGI